MCTIYDIHSQKKKKVLPDPDIDCEDYTAQEFLSCCFAPKNESQLIVTLTGPPDWTVILWDWEKLKIKTKVNIGIQTIPGSLKEEEVPNTYQVSFCAMNDGSVVVTGPDMFRYYRIEEEQLQASLTRINNKDTDITTRYSCHTWMHDGRLIVCTELGEIIILEDDGEYVAFLPDSPIQEEDFKIECVSPMKNGFVVAG